MAIRKYFCCSILSNIDNFESVFFSEFFGNFEFVQHHRFEVLAKWGMNGESGHFHIGFCEFVSTHFGGQRFGNCAACSSA